eukprot:TRINITY_DN4343_c0_g1_i4.p2 TRINITY_DN4343_c0_g1~~TRINITY_DN4343_c0_g1_i4.p2  ORF type:complete len:290 (+),score=121.96 TRINITY_DN4343_c0_g1_i4:1224-2093(+)
MAAFYHVALDPREFKQKPERVILRNARQVTQELINQIFQLPTEREEYAVMAALPPVSTIIPREKNVPEKKPETRWERFAREKGIKKKKRSRMVFDEQTEEYKPRWGKDSVANEKEDWLLPSLPGNGDESDPFVNRTKKRKTVVEKQKKRELRNLHERLTKQGKPLPTTLVASLQGSKMGKQKSELAVQFNAAQRSTASMGHFDNKVENEKDVKKPGKRRKFKPTTTKSLQSEKESNLHMLDKVLKKTPTLNMDKAVNKYQRDVEKQGVGGLAGKFDKKRGKKGKGRASK